jgi:hypothetical protein
VDCRKSCDEYHHTRDVTAEGKIKGYHISPRKSGKFELAAVAYDPTENIAVSWTVWAIDHVLEMGGSKLNLNLGIFDGPYSTKPSPESTSGLKAEVDNGNLIIGGRVGEESKAILVTITARKDSCVRHRSCIEYKFLLDIVGSETPAAVQEAQLTEIDASGLITENAQKWTTESTKVHEEPSVEQQKPTESSRSDTEPTQWSTPSATLKPESSTPIEKNQSPRNEETSTDEAVRYSTSSIPKTSTTTEEAEARKDMREAESQLGTTTAPTTTEETIDVRQDMREVESEPVATTTTTTSTTTEKTVDVRKDMGDIESEPVATTTTTSTTTEKTVDVRKDMGDVESEPVTTATSNVEKADMETREEAGAHWGAIAYGLVGTLAVACVILAITCFVMKYKKS